MVPLALRYRHSEARMRTRIRIGAALLGIAWAVTAQAEDRNPLNATAIVDMGGFFTSTDIRVRLDGEGGSTGDEWEEDQGEEADTGF